VRGTIVLPSGLSFWGKLPRFLGPGLLIAVGYMDPGNWATDIEAGSRYGYRLLFAVVAASLAGMVVQTLSARLGVAAEADLARLCRDRYPKPVARLLWVLSEIAILATDVAEVLGSALALNLLFHIDLGTSVLLTGLDTLIVLGLKGRGFRQVEAIILGLVLTIGAGFVVELTLIPPVTGDILKSLVPDRALFGDPHAIYVAVGILGATVMPHNLYLHASVVKTRAIGQGSGARREAITLAIVDIGIALALAMLINGAILVMAGAAFQNRAHVVDDIGDAYRLLEPLAGSAAAVVFGMALLASGQSSTFTGTIAGQVIIEGFLDLKIPCWQRRVITRALAVIPAFIGVTLLGPHGVGPLLVLTQVALSLQLPFALYPLIRFTSRPDIMGEFASGPILKTVAWSLFCAITVANIWLLWAQFR